MCSDAKSRVDPVRRRLLAAGGLLLAAPALALADDKRPELHVATWPSYYDPANYRRFEALHGVRVVAHVFGSNEEMLAGLTTGHSGWDVVVATNYALPAYARLGLVRPLEEVQFPNFRVEDQDQRFREPAIVDEVRYGIPKDWGTTGFLYDSARLKARPRTWKAFWELCAGEADKRSVVHDYQLTAIGNALKYFGYSFNSVRPRELLQAQDLLLKTKPHLLAISSMAADSLKAGAWLLMGWQGDAIVLARDYPSLRYVIGEEGGEIWCDYYTITRESRQPELAARFIDFLCQPEVNAREAIAHGYPTTDRRANALLPESLRKNPVMFPDPARLTALEFGAPATLTEPLRAAILNKFKAAPG